MADSKTRLSLDNGEGGGERSPRNSLGPGLFLTLPSNFSPSPISPNGGGRSSSGSGGARTPPTPQQHGKGISRGSPSHNYNWEDLRRLFLVSLEKMYVLEPESIPFRQPVDPEALGIPDYIDIIRKPMDLHTIRNKMSGGKYTDPWLYVDDVLRMLDNAWVYNREGSKVYQYCSRLAQVFQKEVNPIMNHLGFRQGRSNSFHFNSDAVNCHGRPVCLVEKGRGFWRDMSRNIEFNLCESCYEQHQSTLLPDTSVSTPVTPDVIPSSPNHQHHIHPLQKSSQQPKNNKSPRDSISSSPIFEFMINSSKAYSPAAELHKSHMRDAEMSRQLVLREFLRMLLASDTTTERKQNVFKMLGCNAKLIGEFVEYVKRRRNIFLSGRSSKDGCCVVIGESFTTKDLDNLLEKLKGITVNNGSKPTPSVSSNDDSISVSSSVSDKENYESGDYQSLVDTPPVGVLDMSLESTQSESEQTDEPE